MSILLLLVFASSQMHHNTRIYSFYLLYVWVWVCNFSPAHCHYNGNHRVPTRIYLFKYVIKYVIILIAQMDIFYDLMRVLTRRQVRIFNFFDEGKHGPVDSPLSVLFSRGSYFREPFINIIKFKIAERNLVPFSHAHG